MKEAKISIIGVFVTLCFIGTFIAIIYLQFKQAIVFVGFALLLIVIGSICEEGSGLIKLTWGKASKEGMP